MTQAKWPEKLPHHDRFDYEPITRRRDYAWPNGARLAVYLGFNLEHFAFGDGLGARIGPASPEPDVLNHGWREYGNRVGAWPDGTAFEGNRYVDRYVVRHGKICEMDVWNDSAEWLLIRAGLVQP